MGVDESMMHFVPIDERVAKSLVGPSDVRGVLDHVLPDETDLTKRDIASVFDSMNKMVFPKITFDEARNAFSGLSPVGVMNKDGHPVAIVSGFRLARKWDIDYVIQPTTSGGVSPDDLPLNAILVNAIRQSLATCMYKRSPLTPKAEEAKQTDDSMM